MGKRRNRGQMLALGLGGGEDRDRTLRSSPYRGGGTANYQLRILGSSDTAEFIGPRSPRIIS